MPITGHHGRSRNLSFGQHAPHSVPGWVTCRRQPAQTGGNSRPRRPAEGSPGKALELFERIVHVGAHHAKQLSARRGWSNLQPIFDTELLVPRKRRALAAAGRPARRFLLDRAVEDLGERLAHCRAAISTRPRRCFR